MSKKHNRVWLNNRLANNINKLQSQKAGEKERNPLPRFRITAWTSALNVAGTGSLKRYRIEQKHLKQQEVRTNNDEEQDCRRLNRKDEEESEGKTHEEEMLWVKRNRLLTWFCTI